VFPTNGKENISIDADTTSVMNNPTASGDLANEIIPFEVDTIDSRIQTASCKTPDTITTSSSRNITSITLDSAGPEITQANDIRYLNEMQEMNEKRKQYLLAEPGWIRRLTRLTILRDGQEYAHESEVLIQVDGTGIVAQVIETEANPNCNCQGGPVVAWARGANTKPIYKMQPEEMLKTQVSTADVEERTYIEGLSPGQPLSLDFDFVTFAQNKLREGATLQHQMIYLDCWYQGEQYSLLDGNRRIEALFKPETGRLRRLQVYDIVDGSIQLVWRVELAKEDKVKP